MADCRKLKGDYQSNILRGFIYAAKARLVGV